MNSLEAQFIDLLRQTHAVRDELWDVLDDHALAQDLGGDTLTLGALCVEFGNVEYAYARSFRSFKQDFSLRCDEPGLADSMERLRDWFHQLDDELCAALESLSEDEVQQRMIDRGDYDLPVSTNFHFYREGLLMFMGKASIYLKALAIAAPAQFSGWVG